MISWSDISLFRFQYIDQTNAMAGIDDMEKVLLITCEIFGLREQQLNDMPTKKANKLLGQVLKMMQSSPVGVARDKIGPYHINYDPSKMNLGQFIELRFFLQDHVGMGHYALASISHKGRKYETDGHPSRADFFLRQPVTDVMASLKLFIDRFTSFLKEYDGLFGLDQEMYDAGQESERFNQRYGWQYSAEQIADYERITLDQAYGLPIRQAFNDLAYLKAKSRYEAEQQKQIMKHLKSK